MAGNSLLPFSWTPQPLFQRRIPYFPRRGSRERQADLYGLVIVLLSSVSLESQRFLHASKSFGDFVLISATKQQYGRKTLTVLQMDCFVVMKS